VGQYKKGKPIWILPKQETVSGSGISWDIRTQFFTGRMPFLLPNQQRQSTEGQFYTTQHIHYSSSSGWTPRIPWTVYRYFSAYPFFTVFHFLVVGSMRLIKLTYVSC